MNKRQYRGVASILVMAAGLSAGAATYSVYANDTATAATVSTQQYGQAELEQMLAPIALYPDALLTHILVASTYPLEVVQAERYVSSNQHLSKQQLIDKGNDMQWDPSIIALLPFKDVLNKMSTELRWTEQLGSAFLTNEDQVMAAVQNLRQKAWDAGTLTNMDNMKVSQDQQTIIIQPVQKEVVYVPYYDSRRVYGHWAWSAFPPVYWHYAQHRHHGHHHSPFHWSPAIHISDGWFIFGVQWRFGHVVVHHHQQHRYYYKRYYNRHKHYYKPYKRPHSHDGYYGKRRDHVSVGNHRWQHNGKYKRPHSNDKYKHHKGSEHKVLDKHFGKPANHKHKEFNGLHGNKSFEHKKPAKPQHAGEHKRPQPRFHERQQQKVHAKREPQHKQFERRELKRERQTISHKQERVQPKPRPQPRREMREREQAHHGKHN